MTAIKEPSPPPNGPIFISHASADDAFARQLREALETQQHPIWVDSRNLRDGNVLNREIEQAIESARHVIVALDRDTVNSGGASVSRTRKQSLKPPARLD